MRDEINNDRPAFPCLDSTESGLHLREPGLSMRDYFAAKAMQGMVSTVKFLKEAEGLNPDPLAVAAYEIADAMLEARDAK